ncbi:hypothetical protein AURDEDRAFT_161452 [Auricularia subglabra TFB-10046 SS5]|nr:hypothetical protein AURDEDRAFT_161452 [Auricularia subglabra TFB-10046 SS5]
MPVGLTKSSEQRLSVLPGAQAAPAPGVEGLAPPEFFEQYIMDSLTTECVNIEALEEPPPTIVAHFRPPQCNITTNTAHMQQGIANNLDQTIEKKELLLREALYTVILRLPPNLGMHMFRFSGKRDISKKAKIMPKAKLPLELDASEWCTDAPRTHPPRECLKVRRKTKTALDGYRRVELSADDDVPMVEAGACAGGELEPEETVRVRERGGHYIVFVSGDGAALGV